ncbi:hypothetical protein VZT92_021177 [Zoarces viviparus]
MKDSQGLEIESCGIKRKDCKWINIEKVANDLLLALGSTKNKGTVTVKGMKSPGQTGIKRSQVKAFSRKWYYDLLRTSRSQLAKFVLDKQLGTMCPVPLADVTEAFTDGWGTGNPFLGVGQFRSDGEIHNDIFKQMFTLIEVLVNLQHVTKNTAAGPDGISKDALLKLDPAGRKLVKMFSSWLVAGRIPRTFKECKTTLLPKTEDPEKRKDINEWRPITIGSLV